MRTISFIICLLLSTATFSQRLDSVIQFSGIVMTSDSLMAVPNVNITSLTSNTATTANYNGFFSFAAAKGDTILFSAVGYRVANYIFPLILADNKYSVIQLLSQDTFYLSETIIYPWPSKEEFRDAFLAYDAPDDYYEIARKNLESELLKEIVEAMPMDADMNADYQTKAMAAKLYYAGQYPPMRIFDVFDWKEFIEAWKRGDYKRDEN